MMKKFVLGGMVVVAALLGNACGGDDSSDSPAGPADSEVTLSSSSDDVVLGNGSSSSVTESPSTSSGQAPQSAESDGSSSSEKAVGGSSSSDGKKSSSSGKVESGSSGKGEKSSSSEGAADSSSSDVVAESSSSEKSSSSVAESSSSVESSSSKEPSSSSVVESSSSVAESSSSSEFSSSSQQNTALDSSYYNAEENTLTDFRDGQIYKTISIGNQIWMAENLKVKKYGKNNIASFCFNNDEQNCDSIGRLYIRSAAFDSVGVFGSSGKGCGKNTTACSAQKPVRGICPKNWHIADSLDWTNLVLAVEENKLNLRATYGWRESCYENPTNGKYGFDALPGYKDDTNFINNAANFWVGESTTRAMIISCWEQSTYIIYAARPEFAYSIRCIKDSE